MEEHKEIDAFKKPEDQVTIKELVLKIRELSTEVYVNWKLLLLVSGFFALAFLINAWLTPKTYSAPITFMVDEDEGGGSSSVSAVLGQFGFGGGGGKFNMAKIIELSRSRKIISMALFERINVKGKEDYLANHIIEEYNFHENRWENDTTGLVGFNFSNHNLDSFSILENKALKKVYEKVVGNTKKGIDGLLSTGYDEDTGILKILTITTNESISKEFSSFLYKYLSRFYIEKTTAKQLLTYRVLKTKMDSLKTSLSIANYKLLNFDDTHRNLSLKKYNLKKLELQSEVQRNTFAYAEAFKNLEIADFSLKNKTPFIVTIDEPLYPLEPIKASKVKAILIGVLIGGFLSILFIIIRKTYREALAN